MSDDSSSFFSRKSFLQRARETARFGRLALGLAWEAGRGLTLVIATLTVVQSLLPVAQLFLVKQVIDRAAFDLGLVSNLDQSVAYFSLSVWIAMSAAVLATGQLISPVASTLQSIAGDRLTGRLGERLIIAANNWPGIARFEDPEFANDINRARSISRAGLDFVLYGLRATGVVISSAGLVITLAALHPVTPVLLIAFAIPLMARQYEYQNRVNSHIYSQTEESRRLRNVRDQMIDPSVGKDVRLFRLGGFFRSRYDSIFTRTVQVVDRLRRTLLVPVLTSGTASSAIAGAVYVYVTWSIVRGRHTLGDLMLFGGAATMLQWNLTTLAFELGFLPMIFNSLPSLQRVLESPPDLPVSNSPRESPAELEQIVFDNVSFTYPGTKTPVLRGVSFEINFGESIALVGHNGAGKTTIIKLLLRLYDPDHGSISINGIDLRDLDPEDLRRHMGVIFQDFVRYELTARENIELGEIAAAENGSRIEQAIANAGAEEVIARLPDGLDTQLGREFGGRELSEGEWQRLALARAFMRNSHILVLDEPTGSLDVETEYHLYLRFNDLTNDRTTILISHRFSTVRMADRILFLEDGVIREEGSHEELIALDGQYATLYRLQASQYVQETSP